MALTAFGIRGKDKGHNIEDLAVAIREFVAANPAVNLKSEDVHIVYNEIERRYVALITYQG